MGPMPLSRILRVVCAAAAALGLAACAGGTSRIENLLNHVKPLDALTVGAVGVVALKGIDADVGWSTRVQDAGSGRYRIWVARMAGMGNGEGEFNSRFTHEARKIATDRACGGYRVLAYEERFESRLLGSSRIAEGEIECR